MSPPHKHHLFLTLLALVTLGLGVFYILHYKVYPIAIINGHIIVGAEFDSISNGALNFYTKVSDTYKKEISSDVKEKLHTEIRRATMERLIEESLIKEELKRRFQEKTLKEYLNEKLNIDRQKIAQASALYGMSGNTIQKTLFEPAAAEELLRETLAKEQINFETWLSNAAQSALIIVLMPSLTWSGKSVELR